VLRGDNISVAPNANPAYLAALRMVARRELSEAQIRQRLARRDHDPADIDAALAALKTDGAIDDARVAAVIARTEALVRRRGKLRARRRIEAAGIAASLAARAVDDVFRELDPDALIESALQKRLRGGAIGDDRLHARLYRYLLAQGFEADRVAAVLRKHRA
jgi:regulatory protein